MWFASISRISPKNIKKPRFSVSKPQQIYSSKIWWWWLPKYDVPIQKNFSTFPLLRKTNFQGKGSLNKHSFKFHIKNCRLDMCKYSCFEKFRELPGKTSVTQFLIIHLQDPSIIFNCYLAAPRPTLGHYRGDSLTHPMLITVCLHIRPECHRDPRSGVGFLSPAERLVGFEPGTFRFP